MNNTVFGTGSNLAMRNISNLDTLKKMVQKWKDEGSKIVLVSGSWDLIHEGHALYLEVAKSYGDILVVGVDSDKKVKRRKGPRRPIVPQQERLRMLSHLRSVDRSEEHTSELQSQSNLVCRLLLEKKNIK